jgi:hypothetical protein
MRKLLLAVALCTASALPLSAAAATGQDQTVAPANIRANAIEMKIDPELSQAAPATTPLNGMRMDDTEAVLIFAYVTFNGQPQQEIGRIFFVDQLGGNAT